MDEGWARALAPAADTVARIERRLSEERRAGHTVVPLAENVFRAFATPFSSVRVVIVGQDPYPTPRHAIGLAFATAPGTSPLPGSLRNILRELADDLGEQQPLNADLSVWADRGVLLLNRTLTARERSPGSHAGIGWEEVTECAIRALVARGGPLVAVLWGAKAATVLPLLEQVPAIVSAHPSPLSAHRGFFGSRPFSRANAFLLEQNAEPIRWSLTT